MERKLRTYMHKGKLRTKRRLPRKLKKKKKKEMDRQLEVYSKYLDQLIKKHPLDWDKYVIFGG